MSRVPETGTLHERGPARRRWTALTAVLAGGLLLAPAAVWAMPAALPVAQEEAAAPPEGPQVIAQGIARLPKGKIAWALQRVDVSGNSATPVEAFPLGFILSDDASVVVLDDSEDVLGILDEGEALFLSGGKPGGLAPWRDPAASFFAVTLVPAEEAASTEATVVGEPFDTPEGRAFEIELGRDQLADGEESVIPGSRSGTPTLFLQTEGTSRLISADGEPVELAEGQYALLAGDVTVRGAGGSAAFIVAAIGEQAPTQSQDAADSAAAGGRNRANRANRANAGSGGGAADTRAARQAARSADRASGSGNNAGGETGGSEEKKASRADRQAAREQRQANKEGAAGTPTPVGEGEIPSAGTPTPGAGVETPETAATPSPVVEQTPEDAATPTETVEQQFTDPDEDQDSSIIETTTPVEETPATDELPVVVETPVVETPVEQIPAEGETPVEEAPIVEQEIVEEAPASESIPQEAAPVEEVPAEAAPAGEAPADVAPVEEVPAEAPAEQPVEQIPADAAPVDDGSGQGG